MELFLIMGGVIIILGLVSYISIKGNINKSNIIKKANEVKEKNYDVIRKREDIESEYDKKQDDIITGHDVITDGVMSIVTKPKHNHSHREPCTPSCPAYNRK